MGYVRQVIGPTEVDHDRRFPHYMLAHLCASYIKLSSITETSTFFSSALEMWCSLFVIVENRAIELATVRNDLHHLLHLLAALAYYDGHYLQIQNHKLVLDMQSGISILLPNDPRFNIFSSVEAKVQFLSAIPALIAQFKFPFPFPQRELLSEEDVDVQMVHYTEHGVCTKVKDSLSRQHHKDFDVGGITVFNPTGIFRDVDSKIRLIQKHMATFNQIFLDHDLSKDDDGGLTDFEVDHNCGSPQLVPIENKPGDCSF